MSLDRLSGLPVVPETALPADVRRGSRADKHAYAAALGFEQVLDRQLVQAMAGAGAGAGASTDGDGSGSGSGGLFGVSDPAGLMQDALTQALTAGGGLGLARSLYTQLEPQERS